MISIWTESVGMAEDSGEGDSLDFISSLPDEILHHILSFVPTDLAVTTCVLSRRWRYIWRDTHSISLDCDEGSAYSVNETLNHHTAPKLLSFHLGFRFASDLIEFPGGQMSNVEYFVTDTWIEFAHSRHPENLSLDFYLANYKRYSFPDNLYLSSSVKRLSLVLHGCTTLVPRATVSWPFLKKLLLDGCNIPNESAVKILSGCPLLESLTIKFCRLLGRLDLSNSMHLTRLEVDLGPTYTGPGPTEIVAPHIHFLSLKSSDITSTLDHVSSLTEAKLDMHHYVTDFTHLLDLKMLAKLHKIDKLTLGPIFLQILSLAELRGVPFPTLKITALTLETEIFQYAVPGITRLLQHSPELKKLTLHLMKCKTLKDKDLTSYTDSRGLEFEVFPNSLETKLASFIEFLLENTKTLETMVLRLEDHLDEASFEELLQMATTLSNNHNNVSIVLINPRPKRPLR